VWPTASEVVTWPNPSPTPNALEHPVGFGGVDIGDDRLLEVALRDCGDRSDGSRLGAKRRRDRRFEPGVPIRGRIAVEQRFGRLRVADSGEHIPRSVAALEVVAKRRLPGFEGRFGVEAGLRGHVLDEGGVPLSDRFQFDDDAADVPQHRLPPAHAT